ncbi:MAG: PspC domain-containing protein [Proteobacteria bacterium]|nr:PspC domain-containing protein [Pseudomonadota bacterium]
MSRRHRKRRKNYAGECAGNYRRVQSRKRSGWSMNLYRNTREGKVAGVCAGLADHWDVAHWVIRLVFIGACLFTGMLAIWVYIGAWFLMAPRSSRRTESGDRVEEHDRYTNKDVEMEYDERRHDYRPKKVFRYSDSGSVRLKRARERLDAALRRVENMESYVTSRQYNLNNEFSKL